MDLARLLEENLVADEVRKTIFELVDLKAFGTEKSVTSRIPVLDDFIRGVLSEPAIRFSLPDRTAALTDADDIFRSIVRRADAGL